MKLYKLYVNGKFLKSSNSVYTLMDIVDAYNFQTWTITNQ